MPLAMDIRDLKTPALLLEKPRLLANLARMADRARALGVSLRPHMKTAKSAAVARLALERGANGIAVSTLAEAAYFLDHGIRDILYAVGLAPSKLDEIAALVSRGAEIKIVTDNVPAAEAIARHPAAHRVLIEVDTGDGRLGLDPADPELIAVARAIQATRRSRVVGVMTHAGQSYDARDPESMARIAAGERAGAVVAAEKLRAAGVACGIVSVGSTPTAVHARDLAGATEMRPGVYMFGDLFQAGIGSCGAGDIAVSVLASVIGHRRRDNAVILDAGALALSKDRSTERLAGGDLGYGQVGDLEGRVFPGVTVVALSQEHGRVSAKAPLPFDRLPIGGRVRIWPNHACITAAGHDVYHVLDGGSEVVAVWDRCRGW
ncbi:MAG: alanine racemase [Rhodospirillales bacterium]|nr:alanine racemase [Rhodospirillales bacterium]